jgi:hypothetical protein
MKAIGRINVGETAAGGAMFILHLRGEAGEDPKEEYQVWIGDRFHNSCAELWEAFAVVRAFVGARVVLREEPLPSEPVSGGQPAPEGAEEEAMTDNTQEARRQAFRLIAVSAANEVVSDEVRLTSGGAMQRVAAACEGLLAE